MVRLEHLPHPPFLNFPNHYTAAFFKSAQDAEHALDTLMTYGYSEEEFNVFEGYPLKTEADQEGSPTDEEGSLLEKFMQKFIKVANAGDWAFLERADAELKNGCVLICVATHKRSEKEEIITVFRQHDAYDIRYFTPMYIEEVERSIELR